MGDRARPTSPAARSSTKRNPPLVIVSERGRHSEESRRIVRAQAARASAPQSRVTRARNREERESSTRESPHSPNQQDPSQSRSNAVNDTVRRLSDKPLIIWLADMLQIPPSTLLKNGPLSKTSLSSLSGTTIPLGTLAGPEASRPQLPMAMPRGFSNLQQRLQISDALVALLSRTSCFDYGSPGVEDRLHWLLFDLIIDSTATNLFNAPPMDSHPIHAHLRIACTCITIFQGYRTNGSNFAYDQHYKNGLAAAWIEAINLNQDALTEPKSAEAALWALFIISVTAAGAKGHFFHVLLRSLIRDLNCTYWSHVRNILFDFIYPASFLDEPCKTFYNTLLEMENDAG